MKPGPSQMGANNSIRCERGKETGSSDCGTFLFLCLSVILIALTFPVSLCFCFERAIVFRLGRVLEGVKGPGLIFFIPCIDSIVKVDVRTKSFDVPPQEVSCVFDHCSGVRLISPKRHA
ncbi:Stomatin-2 [Lamellibrachia satsuma]|nr:Stomatin-2 [Lamellibrachia satsuma]